MHDFDLLNGAIRINIYMCVLMFLVLFHFIFSYYFLCLKRGFKIDFWHSTIFIGYILPLFIVYPFAGSYFNENTIGEKIFYIRGKVDLAFLISLVGYIFTYIGFYYHDFTYKKSFFYMTINKLNDIISELMYFSIKSNAAFRFIYMIAFATSLIVTLLLLNKYGFSFNLRANALADGTIRSIFNLIIISLIPVVLSMTLVRYLEIKSKITFFAALMLMLSLLISGSRSTLFTPIVSVLIIYFISKKKNISIFKIILVGIVLLSFLSYFSNLRNGIYSYLASFNSLFTMTFYGNSFSDLRDFAWILAYWDNHYLLGKSYVAALLSFIPRSLSDYREVWSISVYTDNLVGFDPNMHAGLRPGKFGEAFLNFGWLGVSAVGFITGYILRLTDIKIKVLINITHETVNYIQLYSQTILYSLASVLFITASSWKIYVTIFIIIFGYFIKKIECKKN